LPEVVDGRTAVVVDALCEAIVPGSARVGLCVYVDAVPRTLSVNPPLTIMAP
jgi:hypothetical protein